jgi:hypothetical protein
MPLLLALIAGALAALGGCAAPPSPNPAAAAPMPRAGTLHRYKCDQGVAFTVLFENESAIVDAGARGSETLLRDAGGVTPRQTVYSSTRIRAEFGLGETGNEAVLHFQSPALQARCVRE